MHELIPPCCWFSTSGPRLLAAHAVRPAPSRAMIATQAVADRSLEAAASCGSERSSTTGPITNVGGSEIVIVRSAARISADGHFGDAPRAIHLEPGG